MIAPWQLVSSRYLIQDPWMTLRADTCQLPSGQIVEPYYVQESPDWVQVVAFDAEDRILVTHQYRHAAQAICAELPGGTVEPGEIPEQAARRELLEETGCTVNTLTALTTLYSNPARDCNRIHVFVATGASHTQPQRVDATEAIEFEFLSLPDLLARIDRGGFPQALHIGSLFLALRSRSTSLPTGSRATSHPR